MQSSHGARRLPAAVPAALATALLAAGLGLAGPPSAAAGDLIYVNEGNRLHRIDTDTIGTGHQLEQVLIHAAADASDPTYWVDANHRYRDINGMVCPLPDGSGRFVAAEDTGQPHPPAGWGVFDPGGTQVGKLTATYYTSGPEPYGCSFHPNGTLFTTEVGEQGLAGANGQLIVWFPPFDHFPGPPGAYPSTDAISANFCKIATDIGNATGLAIDAQGRVYVSSANGFTIQRFSGPFPTSVADCTDTDALGSPQAVGLTREVLINSFATPPLAFYTGIAISPWQTLVANSVVNGRILEYSLDGQFLRAILMPTETLPPIPTGNPQGVAFDSAGDLFYTDLDLVGTFPNVDTGPNGRLWRIRFDRSTSPPTPQAPEVVLSGLAFPDGAGSLPGNFEPSEWRGLAGGPERSFFNRDESLIAPDNVDELVVKWRFPTGAIITGSPAVAIVDVGGKPTQVVFFLSWDGYVYAVRASSGLEVWRFRTEDQPGAVFPYSGSVQVSEVDGRDVVFAGAGENLYALDASSGGELWHFTAGTGCRDAQGNPPGLCSFDGERNEIESSPLVMEGLVFFGMDVNDDDTGKGGFYALDAHDGRLAWFFDLESGQTCRPLPGDDVRSFDGYHGTAELGLPADFFDTRPGCDFPHHPNGCGNVWSSPAGDERRGLVFFASSNCDTDDDPASAVPPAPMPPFDEAVVALRTDGSVAWRWRPREVDNDDLAFGAAPNLFDVEIGGDRFDAVGVGNKDGTYYVLPREGTNPLNDVGWDDPEATTDLPFWATRVVAGGDTGGIIGTAAVDSVARRVYFATAAGDDIFAPQQPTMHALDLDTGAVVWSNAGTEPFADSSFAPTSALRGVVFQGSVLNPELRAYRSQLDLGTQELALRVNSKPFGSAVASGAVAANGLVFVGAGVGARSSNPSSTSDATSRFPTDLVALCVPGTPPCPDLGLHCGAGAELAALAPLVLGLGALRRRRRSAA